jgi:GPH family glycoside/pentoside/hexuronide:cation symporter
MSVADIASDDRVKFEAQPRAADPALSVRTCLSYGVGTVGTAILLNVVAVYLPAFMATVLGKSTAIAGTLLMVSKLYDILADIVIGVASDRTRSRLGRRRPYLLAGAILSAITVGAIFDPPLMAQIDIVWIMAALLVLYSTAYSLFNVPYMAIPAEIAGSFHGRTRLLSFRTFFVAVGQLIALSGTGWLLQGLGGGRHGYAVVGWIMAAVILVTELGTFFGLRDVAGTERTRGPETGWRNGLRSAAGNRPFILLMGSKLMQLIALSASVTTSLLFMLNTLKVGYSGQASFSLAQNIAIAASMPVWVRIAPRIGKKWTYIGAIAVYSIVSLSWLAAGQAEPLSLIAARGVGMGLSAGGILLMGTSMLADTMAYDHLRTGLRREGMFSSLYAMTEKMAYAIGTGLMGVYLSVAGYISTTQGHLAQQPASVTTALYFGVAVLPVLLMAVSTMFLFFYSLDEQKLTARD